MYMSLVSVLLQLACKPKVHVSLLTSVTSVSKVQTRDLHLPLSRLPESLRSIAFRPGLRDELLLATVGHPLPLSDQRARVPYSPSVGD